MLVDDTRVRLMAVAEAHPEWRGRVAASLTLRPAGVVIDLDGHHRGSLLLELGFALPRDLEGPRIGERHAILDERGVAGIDRDLLIWVDGRDDPTTIAELPGRRTLDAHRSGRELYLDRLVPDIEAAVDGNPSTLARSAVLSGLAP